uniref:Uncharacterized protein n=1 Tax=Ananas comosus var. bracteatus TaxID=296719 RepID=A0A6V7Q600_ANACO|nr:unnamed protein product [Ananas comosus var. bracteatus]
MESSDYLARRPLHVVFFPFMATGHMPPMVDMANLFAARGGVATTVVATPANAPLIDSRRLPVPTSASASSPSLPALTGLPPGIENIAELSDSDSVNSFYELEPDYIRHFREAMGHRAWHVGPLHSSVGTEPSFKGGSARKKNKKMKKHKNEKSRHMNQLGPVLI